MARPKKRVATGPRQGSLFDDKDESQMVRCAGAAPRQALGFSVQYTRFSFLLLRAGPGTSVSFEVLDDVAVHREDETLLSQTKSVESNPVSDRAVDLWKTFANWVQTVKDGLVDPTKTIFELYITKVFSGPIAESLDKAKDLKSAKEAFQAAREELWGPSPRFPKKATVGTELAPHLDAVFSAEEVVVPIIMAFQLQCSDKDPRRELEEEVQRHAFDARHVRDIADHLEGWVKSRVDDRLRKDLPAVIHWDDFHVEYFAFSRKLTERHFLASMASEPDDDEIQEHRAATFVRQLELIDLDFDDQIEAIIDYHKATLDRVEWAETGDVHSTSFDVLDHELQRAWKNLKRQSDTALNGRSDLDRGQDLNSRCMLHNCKIQGFETEQHFIRGAFHQLADDSGKKGNKPAIGWHPNYDTLLAKKTRRVKR